MRRVARRAAMGRSGLAKPFSPWGEKHYRPKKEKVQIPRRISGCLSRPKAEVLSIMALVERFGGLAADEARGLGLAGKGNPIRLNDGSLMLPSPALSG